MGLFMLVQCEQIFKAPRILYCALLRLYLQHYKHAMQNPLCVVMSKP